MCIAVTQKVETVNSVTESSESSHDESEEDLINDSDAPIVRWHKKGIKSVLQKKRAIFTATYDRSEVKRRLKKSKNQIKIIEDDYIDNEVVFISNDVYSLTIAANLT